MAMVKMPQFFQNGRRVMKNNCDGKRLNQYNIIMSLRALACRLPQLLPLLKAQSNKLKQRRMLPNLVLAATVGAAAYYLAPHKIRAIEDQEIQKVKKEMDRVRAELMTKYGGTTDYPTVKCDLRGNTYQVQFDIDQRKCNIFVLLTQFFSHYNDAQDGSYRVCDLKTLAKGDVLTFYIDFEQKDPKWRTPQKGRLTVTGIRTNQRPNFKLIFEKADFITDKDIEALKQSYRQAVKPKEESYMAPSMTSLASSPGRTQKVNKPKASQNQNYKKLQQFGVTVFDPLTKSSQLDWDSLAGYESQKRAIEDTILLTLEHPHIYDEITQMTRMKNEPNRPKAILFEGPPGTGKTTSAKIISQQVRIPLVYIPIEAIMSEFYGKSERNLAEMWEICKNMGKVIIFIDEIDALARSRSSDMHEASRRILSTLLRKIDSFESTTNVMLICATNRKEDLDPAMLSRIDLSIPFNLPDVHSRAAIFKRYAKHLSDEERKFLAQETEGFSGRNISDVCKHAERRWASKVIKKQVTEKIPNFNQYFFALNERKAANLN